LTLPVGDVEKMQCLVMKAANNKCSLNEYTAFVNLTGSHEHRESTAQVYADPLEPFCNNKKNKAQALTSDC